MFKLHNHNIILPKYLEIVKKKGSSLSLPAHGLGGARATSLLVAHFALRNTVSNSAEKKGSPSRSEAFPPSWHQDIKAKQFSIPFKKNLAGGR